MCVSMPGQQKPNHICLCIVQYSTDRRRVPPPPGPESWSRNESIGHDRNEPRRGKPSARSATHRSKKAGVASTPWDWIQRRSKRVMSRRTSRRLAQEPIGQVGWLISRRWKTPESQYSTRNTAISVQLGDRGQDRIPCPAMGILPRNPVPRYLEIRAGRGGGSYPTLLSDSPPTASLGRTEPHP